MPEPQQKDLERAATSYRLALQIKDLARATPEFPKVSAKLEEAARMLLAEGKKAEAAEK
jgi:hypothetical protein